MQIGGGSGNNEEKKEVLMESKRWKKMQKDDKNIELFGERDKTEGLVYKKI